jgi:glycosyltransferase involved in cell wall biosynthesis
LTPSLSIVIPAYNEENRLPATLARVKEFLRRGSWTFTEILVVDDGSADGTAALARGAGARVVANPGNRGKGYSARHGMLEACGEWILLTDADLSTPIEEIEKLCKAAEAAGAAAAIGSRALNRALVGTHQSLPRELMGRTFNLVMRLVTGLPFRDTQCGFKLFEGRAAREIFRRQLLDGFGFDVEVLVIARDLGYRVVEVPVRWNDVRGTKVSLVRGMDAFFDPLRVRLNRWRGRYR